MNGRCRICVNVVKVVAFQPELGRSATVHGLPGILAWSEQRFEMRLTSWGWCQGESGALVFSRGTGSASGPGR